MPPCLERVVWRVLDLPLPLSKSQLRRIEHLILEQKDESCEKVEVAYNGTVNRPIQTRRTSPKIWCCTSDNWGWKRLKGEAPEWKERMHYWPRDYHGFRGLYPENQKAYVQKNATILVENQKAYVQTNATILVENRTLEN